MANRGHALSAEQEALMRSDAPRISEDKLEKLRDAVRRKRDLECEIADREEKQREQRARLMKMEHDELPALFMSAGVDHVGLPREGNHPAYDATLRPYYKASISSEWPEEKQLAGIAVCEKLGWGDLVKNVVTIELGRGDNRTFKKVASALRKLKVGFSVRRAVPWNSLTAAVRERYEDGEPLGDAELRALGATVGSIVRLTERKEK